MTAEQNALVMQWMGLVGSIVRQYPKKFRDDLRQTGLAKLCYCALHFDASKGFQLSTYVYTPVRVAIWHQYRFLCGEYRRFARKIPGREKAHFIAASNIGEHSIPDRMDMLMSERGIWDDPWSELIDREYAAWLVKELTANADERKRYILMERVNGKMLEEIGDVLGITRERVRQIQAKAEEWIRVEFKARKMEL